MDQLIDGGGHIAELQHAFKHFVHTRAAVFFAQGVIVVQPDISDVDHEFWPDGISLGEDGRLNWDGVFGHGQVTDLYLLALAVAHRGALATFDHRIALNAVSGARKANLLLL